jgi:hypothetical protein
MLQEEDILIMIYCAISDTLLDEDYLHSQGKLWLSEIILCGTLHALKGGSFRQFYTWIKRRNIMNLPERTRLERLLKTHKQTCSKFLAKPSFFTIMDSFGIEVIRPIRAGRSAESASVSAKGKSGHRWIIGRKICVRISDEGMIVSYADDTANVCDKIFNHLAEDGSSITLADSGFRDKDGVPENMKICQRGRWNERMNVETLFSLWDRICGAKRIFVRSITGFKTRIAYLATLTNILFSLNKKLDFKPCSMVQYAL